MQFDSSIKDCIILVYDMLGAKILEKNITNCGEIHVLDFYGKPKGLYNLTIRTKDGVLNKKIVVN